MLKISELAQLLGVTTQTIRNFEKAGYKPLEGTSEAGYRLYNRYDLIQLSVLRGFQQCGFSIQQSYDMISAMDTEQQCAALSAQAKTLEHELAMMQRRLARLHETQHFLSVVDREVGVYREEMSPGLYAMLFSLDSMNSDNIVSEASREHLSAWAGLMPVSRLLNLFSVNDFHSDARSFCCGYAVEERDVGFLPHEARRCAMYIPSTRCLHTVVSGQGKKHSYVESLQDVSDYLLAHGYVMTGYPFGLNVFVDDFAVNRNYYTHLYIPIE